MFKTYLKKQIEELEVLIKETEDTIKEAYVASETMVEPCKTVFVKELGLKQLQLNTNKAILEQLKMEWES